MIREHREILRMIRDNCEVCERTGDTFKSYEITRIKLFLDKVLGETNETGIPE